MTAGGLTCFSSASFASVPILPMIVLWFFSVPDSMMAAGVSGFKPSK
jgi:hypothetical protein